MPAYFAVITLVAFMLIVIARALMLKKQGIQAMNFGRTDKSDFLIPPFALFYFYLVFAAAFNWPSIAAPRFFQSEPLAWVGVALCFLGLLFFAWAVVSFGSSFRVGIDEWHPGGLVTAGAFSLSRNPIYTAFALILVGQFLIFPSWIMLLYALGGFGLFHRQALREEAFLIRHYGDEFLQYARRVRRYL